MLASKNNNSQQQEKNCILKRHTILKRQKLNYYSRNKNNKTATATVTTCLCQLSITEVVQGLKTQM